MSFAVLHGLYWLAANLAARHPTAIVVDDLHWADAPTLRWLTYLARRLEGLPLLVVLGLRPPEQSVETDLLTELIADPTALVIRPNALSVSAVASMAREEFGVEPEDAFVVACHAATGGNPLFLRAILDAMHGEGFAPTAENAKRVREIGPEAVARAVMLRLSRLPAEARQLAVAAAVLGDGAELRDAAALAQLDDRHLSSLAATALARADLVRVSTQTVEFVHPVVRAAVYESIEPAERLLAHRRAAEILEESGAEPERVAAHLVLVPVAGDPFVVETLRLAGDRALVRGAPEAAVRYLRRALEEPPTEDTRVDALLELGLAEQRVDIAAAAGHLEEALSSIEPAAAARAGRARARPLALPTQPGPGCRTGPRRRDRAARRLGARAARDARGRTDQLGRFRQRSDRGLARADSPHRRGRTRRRSRQRGADRNPALLRREARPQPRRRLPARAAEIRAALIESMPSIAISCAATALMYAEYDEEIDRFFEAIMQAAKQRGELVTLSNMLCFRGLALAQRGDLDAAIEDLRESDKLVPYLPTQQGAIYFHSYLADVLTNRGELDEAEAVLAELGLPEEVAESGHLIFFLGARGWVRLARGNLEGARSDFERLGRCMDAFELRNPAVVAWRSHLALALLGLGRRDEALELAREEVELARAWRAKRPIGVALRVQGVAEGGEAGIELLRESLEVLKSSSAKLELARTMVELGAALRRAGEDGEASELLQEGLDLAVRAGSQPLVEQAETELAATGARPERLLLSGVESLTASERRVADFAVGGLANKDIAQALFLTTKAVEEHLSDVYRKLGIGSLNDLSQELRS